MDHMVQHPTQLAHLIRLPQPLKPLLSLGIIWILIGVQPATQPNTDQPDGELTHIVNTLAMCTNAGQDAPLQNVNTSSPEDTVGPRQPPEIRLPVTTLQYFPLGH